MGRGRPGKGWGHIDGLEGEDAEKARMKRIFQTVSGELTVREAAKALGISEARFFAMREEVLQQWLDALQPRPPGRPPKHEETEPAEVEALLRQIKELQLDLKVAQTRTELALTMPHVLKDRPKPDDEKGGPKARRRGKPKWFDENTDDT
jgi:hypothetical protein